MDGFRGVTNVVVGRVPGLTVRYFDVGAEVCFLKYARFELPVVFPEHEAFQDIGPVGQRLIGTIQTHVDGVTEVSFIDRYRLRVTINKAFSWDSVEPKLFAALSHALGTYVATSVDYSTSIRLLEALLGDDTVSALFDCLGGVNDGAPTKEESSKGEPEDSPTDAPGGPDGTGL